MTARQGTYDPFLQGVSQQTPQARSSGQLGAQLNMVSDIVAGLRRRSGVKYHSRIDNVSTNSFIRMIELAGEEYIVIVDTDVGQVKIINFQTGDSNSFTDDYFKASSKLSIKSTMSRDNYFILNTEKIPQKELLPELGKNPSRYGYFNIRSSAFSKWFYFDIAHPSWGTIQIAVPTGGTDASQATPEYVATELESKVRANTTLNNALNIQRTGTTVAFEMKDVNVTDPLVCESTTGVTYVVQSGASRVQNKSDLLGTLPALLDGYTIAVGNVGNSAYYKYNNTIKKWSEVAIWERPYKITNTPYYIYIDEAGNKVFKQLAIQPRMAGEDDNNPMPKFIGYGITGIGAYQSRLVLLSGAYVNLSKTTEFNQFMRSTVTELRDDDAIETSNAGLSSAQFEYCLPYNKDLVLIAQTQQAVIPANSTVLTPKNAVIYPSTKVELSLACEPEIASRTLYYVYQRGDSFYQVGEFIPNTYTDAQYYNQNLTDHIPLYAKGKCTNMSNSTTNNMVVCTSDSPSLLINQYQWQGDQRAQLAFHEWVYPLPVVHTEFHQEFLLSFMPDGHGNIIIGTQNVQLNQLDDKPVPYLDLYHYVEIIDGSAVLPTPLLNTDFVAVIYDHETMRHKEVAYTVQGNVIKCPYDGVIALGYRYKSLYSLTPPFIKDKDGKVIAGAKTTIVRLIMEFKNTGTFNVSVRDTMGSAFDGMYNTAYTWSEAQLGYSWVNSVGSVVIPCRTRLSSTECTIETDSTTDLNLVSTDYLVRPDMKRRL